MYETTTTFIFTSNTLLLPLSAAQHLCLAEGRGFEPLRPGSQDITVFKTGAISRSANLPLIVTTIFIRDYS